MPTIRILPVHSDSCGADGEMLTVILQGIATHIERFVRLCVRVYKVVALVGTITYDGDVFFTS